MDYWQSAKYEQNDKETKRQKPAQIKYGKKSKNEKKNHNIEAF